MSAWQLAQMNVAQARWATDRPEMADFLAQIAATNAVAEASPGFVWRLTEDSGETTRLVNISVWESVEALKEFVYKSAHIGVFRDRERWFEKPSQANQVLWWVPTGHRPGYAEGHAKLALLVALGPSPDAFTFGTKFPKQSVSDTVYTPPLA
jgi:heme-degrading monooxygenase HmoA